MSSPLPAGWDSVPFRDCLAELPVAKPRKIPAREYAKAGTIPVVDQGKGFIAGWTDDTEAVIRDGLPYVVFGDHTRVFKYVDFPFALGADGTQLLKPRADFNPLFFYFACRHLPVPNRGYNRHFSLLKEFDIPRPPSNEQSHIAAVLALVQRAIANEEKRIATTREVMTAARARVIQYGMRGERQRETSIGLVPLSWALQSPAEVFKLTSGARRPADLSPVERPTTPYPVLGGNGVMGYSAFWNIDAPATLVIGRVGEYCGAVHVARGKAWITDNALYAREWLNSDADVDYVAIFLAYYDLNRFRNKAGQPLVTQGIINEHLISLPSPDEQREIVAALRTIQDTVLYSERRGFVLRELFGSLLDRLMTGEIRVDNLNADTSTIEAA